MVYGFGFAFMAIHLAPAAWWTGIAADQGVPDYQAAFAAVFGQGPWTIWGSLVAFMLGQRIDVSVYHRIRRRTGDRHAWVRATGSTAVTQLSASHVVLYMTLLLGRKHWEMLLYFAGGRINYIYTNI